ncbi:unnamed protein product [Discula destructiva]
MSSRDFNGKVVALTGAASGIGLQSARLLASRGAKLSLADVQWEPLQALQKELEATFDGVEVIAHKVDVRQYEQVEEWISATVEKFGRLDGAANLAGVIPTSSNVADQDLDQWKFVTAVNLDGVMHCLRAQLKVLKNGAAIVNCSSTTGLVGSAGLSSYVASKHAIIGLTKSAAKEAGQHGVRVNAVCPGNISTPMSHSAFSAVTGIAQDQAKAAFDGLVLPDISLRRMGQPSEVATLIAFLLSDEASYISGSSIVVDGGTIC